MRLARLLLAVTVIWGAPGCTPDAQDVSSSKPNVLFVVWDTVRADHLQLYGYDRPTTPHLAEWARGARVFRDCQSTANSTVPSTAAMFTGLLPDRHGASFGYRWLDDEHATLAEAFQTAGYGTFLWSSNPHLSSEANLTQGFDVEHHPWDDRHLGAATAIVARKVRDDRATKLGRAAEGRAPRLWELSAAGKLTAQTLRAWLDTLPADQPYFAFVNWMEAHQPYVPPRRYRERMMSAPDVARSYMQDRTPAAWWGFTFGYRDYSARDLAIVGATYDAALAELDELFHSLLVELELAGHLRDTIVVLVADHGEFLGEHHLVDHQYALYQPLLAVPLVIHAPGRVEPGIEVRPVMNFDLYPTLLELAGLGEPPPGSIDARSLLRPSAQRARVSICPAVFPIPFRHVRAHDPGFDFAPWRRRYTAVRKGHYKLIRADDGSSELFDLQADPGELVNLVAQDRELAREYDRLLTKWQAGRPVGKREREDAPPLSGDQIQRLRALGYAE